MFWDRRGARGSRRLPHRRKSLFKQVLALAATRPVFTADYYAVDGVTSKVASWIDWNDATHTLAQATSANQVALPATHADFANKLCATFTGAEWYVSNRAASRWRDLHNGNGDECVLTATLTGTSGRPCCTRSTGNTVGFSLAFDSLPNALLFLNNGSATFINISSSGGATANTPLFFRCSYLQSGSPQARLFIKSSLVASTTSGSSPSAGDPAGSFTLGASANTGLQATPMRMRDCMFFPQLSASGVSTLHNYIQWDTGIAP